MTAGERPVASLRAGISWNLGALVVMALAGLVLNLVIARQYGSAALGTFNIAFAIFIFASQIATFGIHFSTLQAVSTFGSDLEAITGGAVLACLTTAIPIALAGLLAAPLLARLMPGISDLESAWLILVPCLVFFALNKVLLAIINGLERMQAFAVFQALRFVFIMLTLLGLMAIGAPASWLVGTLTIGEGLLLPLLVINTLRLVRPKPFTLEARRWAKRHLRFGWRAMPAGVVSELNTRVDVLMIGFWMGDRAAGIYTIAGLIFEAAFQVIIVVRNNLNPRLGRFIATGRTDQLLDESRKVALLFTPVLLLGSVLTVMLFPLFVELILQRADFADAAAPLAWLMASLCLAGAPLCYSMVFSQAGHPGWQSGLMMLSLAVNVLACVLLVPPYGIVGGAIAAGLSALTLGLATIVVARRLLGIRLIV